MIGTFVVGAMSGVALAALTAAAFWFFREWYES